jgi:hypothetical protein
MRIVRSIAVISVLAAALLSTVVLGDDSRELRSGTALFGGGFKTNLAPVPNPPAKTPANQVSSANPTPTIAAPDKASTAEKLATSAKVQRQGDSEQLKKLLSDIKVGRAKFLQEQKDLQARLTQANGEDRDRIRAEIRDKRDQFLEQQKDLRAEILQRVTELKDQLKDHQDLIDSTKDQKGKHGKGGGG